MIINHDSLLVKQLHSSAVPSMSMEAALPFENYRNSSMTNFLPQTNIVSQRNNSNAGADRVSDDDDDDDQADGDDEDEHGENCKKQISSQSSRPNEMLNRIVSSPQKPTSFVRTSSKLMMNRENEKLGEKNRTIQEFRPITLLRPNSSGSSTSSSSIPVDEQQSRRYHFVPASSNSRRSVAKSTDQLNHSLANDSILNSSQTSLVPSFQMPAKPVESTSSFLKSRFMPSTPSSN